MIFLNTLRMNECSNLLWILQTESGQGQIFLQCSPTDEIDKVLLRTN